MCSLRTIDYKNHTDAPDYEKIKILKFTETSDSVQFDYGRNYRWERHPDGTGFYASWSPLQGQRYFVIGGAEIYNQCRAWNETMRKAIVAKRERIKLGELEPDIAIELLKDEYEKLLAEALEWCKNR